MAFSPALAQLAHPMHANVRDARRFRYVAEGKETPMYVDVLAFDECRYVYDWLPALDLIPDDWGELSTQLVFRFALDGIAKEKRWISDDFLSGCHAIGVNQPGFEASEFAPRRSIDARSKGRSRQR